MKSSKIAILMTVYNGEEWLSEQIQSILSQKNVLPFIFISIDSSTDDSEKICTDFLEKHKNVFILPMKGKFGNAALNFFRLINDIDFSMFDYICFSDQDDIWLPEKLDQAIKQMKHNQCDGYSSNLTAFDVNSGKKWIINKSYKEKKFDYLFQGASAGCTYVLTRKSAILVQKKLKNINLKMHSRPSHDWTIYAICRSHGIKWFFDENSLIMYRQHSNNFYGESNGWQGILKRNDIIKSGWYKNQILFLEPLLSNTHEEKKIFNSIKKGGILGSIFLSLRTLSFRRKFFDSFYLSIIILIYF